MGLIEKVSVPEGELGPWRIERFTIEDSSVGMLALALRGRSIPAGEYTRLMHRSRGCVMSDTPSEMNDHLGFVLQAKGNVLINGLGLGMVLAAILSENKPGEPVTKVTVVEQDQDVIDLVAPHYRSDPRVNIVCADALEYRPQKGERYDAVWHDIWDSITTSNLPDMKKLHRRYGRIACWQGSWRRESCERMMRSRY